jgi:RNA polymerase sigma-70 factor, ECF subfamily
MSASMLSLSSPADSCDNGSAVSVEHELLSRAREGDGRAFRALIEPHLGMLYRIAARAAGNSALAEDAVQEALTTAFIKLDRYQAGTSLKAFLAAIAVGQARTLLRGERRRKSREEQAAPGDQVAEPAAILEAEQAAAAIREALAAMPRKRREVALLRLDGALSYAEIALALGTTEGSARVLLHLALRELRERLEPHLAGGENAGAEKKVLR